MCARLEGGISPLGLRLGKVFLVNIHDASNALSRILTTATLGRGHQIVGCHGGGSRVPIVSECLVFQDNLDNLERLHLIASNEDVTLRQSPCHDRNLLPVEKGKMVGGHLNGGGCTVGLNT